MPENINEEIFDAEDLNIDTSGLTNHIDDCINKLTNGEDMQLSDLSRLNVSDKIKDMGNNTKKDTENVPKSTESMETVIKTILERHDEKDTESPFVIMFIALATSVLLCSSVLKRTKKFNSTSFNLKQEVFIRRDEEKT